LFWETRQNQQTKPRSSKSIMAANKMCSLWHVHWGRRNSRAF
jgi:hypothetical protein